MLSGLIHVRGFGKVDPLAIVRIEAAGDCATVYLIGRSRGIVTSRMALKYFSALLPHFVRTHSGHLVNPDYIECSVRGETGGNLNVKVTDGSMIPVARRRVKEVTNFLRDGFTDSNINKVF